MEKYSKVQSIVTRLTDNPTFKTFYTLYLMAENQKERQVIEDRFWKDVERLPSDEKHDIRAEFTRSFLKLPVLVKELSQKVNSLRATR